MSKILSISVAAYNAQAWLARCLDSFCMDEVLADIDVMIINDGSTDFTRDVALGYVERYPDTFRLIDKQNGGHGSTINTGIKAARGRYFKLVDADDWVEREGLIDLVKKLKGLGVDAVISPYYKVNANNMGKMLVPACGKDGACLGHEIAVEDMDPACEVCLHALTFRTALLREHYTPIDEHCFFVDLEYVAFYFSHVRTVYLCDVPVYDYLVGTDFQSVSIANMLKRRGQHLRMVRRMIDFYDAESRNAELPYAAARVVKYAIISEYGVLLKIPDEAQSLAESRAWENELKSRSPELYKEAISFGIKTGKETALAVRLLRLLRFHGYCLMHKIFARHAGTVASQS